MVVTKVIFQIGQGKGRVWRACKIERGISSLLGKEVMLKAVGQAIPSYTMSCFELQEDLCKYLERICA